jgi:hypothetical protein
MRIAVMQPYLFPYLGYFQLIRSCDEFVLYDDVQYKKHSWVNRNCLLLSGKRHRFTVPVLGASLTKTFNDVKFDSRESLLTTIRYAYAKAPYFSSVFPLLVNIFEYSDRTVATFIRNSLAEVLRYIGIPRPVTMSSDLDIEASFRGQPRVLEICRRKKATEYVNSAGGKALYDPSDFSAAGISLRFLYPDPIEYKQFGGPFIDNLSIIDVLMFNAPSLVAQYTERFSLSK